MKQSIGALSVALALIATACKDQPVGPGPAPAATPVTQSATDLFTARKAFQTHLLPSNAVKDPPAVVPPANILQLVKYNSDAGQLAAYLTNDPKDGKKHPAVVWAHSGFGGIGPPAWLPGMPQKDLSVNSFLKAGVVTMVPAWRGENGNPGQFELFYGEVNDLLAAVDFVSKLPWVDPQRVYVAGHSIGGTLALLTATTADTGKVRAFFSLGGAPNVGRIVSNGKGYGNTPFDYHNAEEGRLRSALYFAKYIKRPTFYFEGAGAPTYLNDVAAMQQAADDAKVPFKAYKIPGHDHFDIVAPITKLIAAKINADTGPATAIDFTPQDLDKALDVMSPADLKAAPPPPKVAAPPRAPAPQKHG